MRFEFVAELGGRAKGALGPSGIVKGIPRGELEGKGKGRQRWGMGKGRLAHQRWKVLGWPWRIDFSLADSRLIAFRGRSPIQVEHGKGKQNDCSSLSITGKCCRCLHKDQTQPQALIRE